MKKLISSLSILVISSLLTTPCLSHAASTHIDQRALDLLKRSSDTLAGAHEFTYRSSSTVEVSGKNGQLVTLFAKSRVALKRPNKLRVLVTGEVPNFDFYYNGSTIAAYAPKTNVYSVSKAPATIDTMLPFLKEKTGIHFPSAGMLFSNPYAVLSKNITSAFVVGSDIVDGIPCNHLAFSAPGVNWEIWLESGSRALPLRLVVIYTDVSNFPRFLVEFSHWNLHPWFIGTFDLKKPASAKEITFLPIGKKAASLQ
ncbi:MAG: DUF2092 domain-containing protein [Chthoniobacterales bacterium]